MFNADHWCSKWISATTLRTFMECFKESRKRFDSFNRVFFLNEEKS